MADKFGTGIVIASVLVTDLQGFSELARPHRDDYHLFFLQEKGTSTIEIDFQKHDITPSSVVCIHPDQVHRMVAFEDVTVSVWMISNEELEPEYLKLLEEITPTRPLTLNNETFSLVSDAVSLCIKFSERKHGKSYHSLLRDSCNILVALVASQYLEGTTSPDTASRYELITKAFRSALERSFTAVKRPAAYAQNMNISTAYLNECVKNTTGHPVSYHIQQRIILEAKRLLYHSGRSVKEIATELGYEDHAYFSRLFTKVAGMTALTFRHKNHD